MGSDGVLYGILYLFLEEDFLPAKRVRLLFGEAGLMAVIGEMAALYYYLVCVLCIFAGL